MLIDSHCHVLSTEYENVEKIIEDSFKTVDKIIINGYDLKSSKEAVALANRYDNVYAAVGIGPENIGDLTKDSITSISELAKNNKVVAIGEIGLDYYWTKENKDNQIKVFKDMLNIAEKNNLPVIVHSRSATQDVYNMLKESGVNGIIHCFSGSLESAKDFIKLGFLIGIGGVVTFKNAKNIKNVVENIQLCNISLETDSPYLAPEPFRGKKNDPSKIIYVAEEIAKIKNVSVDLVINETSEAVCSKFDLS